MPEQTKKITSWISKIKLRPISYSKKGIRPARGWHSLLTFVFVVMCLMIVFAYYFYTQIDQGKMFAQEEKNNDASVFINNNLLEKTANEVRFRESNLQKFNQNRSVPSDPSI